MLGPIQEIQGDLKFTIIQMSPGIGNKKKETNEHRNPRAVQVHVSGRVCRG